MIMIMFYISFFLENGKKLRGREDYLDKVLYCGREFVSN